MPEKLIIMTMFYHAWLVAVGVSPEDIMGRWRPIYYNYKELLEIMYREKGENCSHCVYIKMDDAFLRCINKICEI